MTFTDVSDEAPHHASYCLRDPWVNPPPYSGLVGFAISMVVPDLLHVLNMGVGRDLCGSVLALVLKERVVFEAGSLKERMALASQSLRTFARLKGWPLKMKRFTRKKLGWGPSVYPELKTGSAYDTAVVSRWLEQVLQPHSQQYPECCALLWSINSAMAILYGSHSWFLSSQDQSRVKTLGSLFLQVYVRMAVNAISAHKFIFRCRPKLHLLDHLLRSRRRINCARYSTWMDEDFLKHIGHTLRLTSGLSAQTRTLQRWLLLLPESLRQSMAS